MSSFFNKYLTAVTFKECFYIPTEDGLPVERVEHFDSDQHRQGHGCGEAGLKHLTVYALEHGVVLSTLHEVSL